MQTITHSDLDEITNNNGGGLSVQLTGKYTSVRHQRAKIDGKLTAGEASKYLKKEKIILSAKEVVEAYKLLTGREPEWHHAGFYKSNGKSTMGRTFFFKDDDINYIIENFDLIQKEKDAIEAERKRKESTIVYGFYYYWERGNYGSKNYKKLAAFKGNELQLPSNFTQCSEGEYLSVLLNEGRSYHGWDEPKISEFESISKIKYNRIIKEREELKLKKEAERVQQIEKERIERELRELENVKQKELYDTNIVKMNEQVINNRAYYDAMRNDIEVVYNVSQKPGHLQWNHRELFDKITLPIDEFEGVSRKQIINLVYRMLFKA